MKTSKILMMAAASVLATTPALAAPTNPAASLSVSKSVRTGSVHGDKDKLAGGGFVIAAIAVAAVIAGVVIIATNNDNSSSR